MTTLILVDWMNGRERKKFGHRSRCGHMLIPCFHMTKDRKCIYFLTASASSQLGHTPKTWWSFSGNSLVEPETGFRFVTVDGD